MATLDELVVQLTADTAGLRAELANATKATQQNTQQMEKAIESFSQNSTKQLTFFEQSMATMVGFLAGDAVKGAFNALGSAVGYFTGKIGESIQAVSEEEKGLTRLANSLALSGNYTKEAMSDLQAFVATMDETAGVAGEVGAASLALLSSLTKLNSNGLIQAQQAALDLSAALGMDLQTATQLVAKGINGNTEAFKRYGLEIQKGSTSTETFKNVVDTLNKQFGGAAAGAVKNFGGTLDYLNERYNDLFDEMAKIITQNPVVIAMMQELGNIFKDNAGEITGMSVALKEGLANAFLTTIQVIMVGIETVDLFIRTMEAGLRAIILPINAVADALRYVVDILDGTQDNEAFKSTKQQWDDLSNAISGDSTLSRLNEKLGQIYVAGENAFSKIKESSDTVTPSIKNQVSAVQELTEAEKARLEVLKQFVADMAKQQTDQQQFYANQLEDLKLKSEMELITEAEYYTLRQEAAQAHHDKLQEMQNEAVKKKVSSEKELADSQLTLWANHDKEMLKINNERKKAEAQNEKDRAANLKSSFSYIATLAQSSNRELAAIGKAAAITTATIDGYAAVQKALASAPPPYNFALAAAVGVATTANIAKIAGVPGFKDGITEVPRRAGGGNLGDNFPAMLNPGERVVDRGTNEDLKAFLANANRGSSVNININIAPGTGISREQAGMLVESLNDYFTSGGIGLVNPV